MCNSEYNIFNSFKIIQSNNTQHSLQRTSKQAANTKTQKIQQKKDMQSIIIILSVIHYAMEKLNKNKLMSNPLKIIR